MTNLEQLPEDERSAILADYFNLVRFPTVGTDPAHLRDCAQCAMWIREWLKPLGFVCELVQAEGMAGAPPVLFAERPGAPNTPVVLFYGHYDVQPPDPLDEWNTPPFEPTLKDDGRVYARGAQDDKGQWFAFLCGLKSLLKKDPSRPLPAIKIVLEGQEESGSTALFRLLSRDARPVSGPDFPSRVKADVLCVCDTSAAADLRPAIIAGLRGVSHFTVRLEAANRDLHSGAYGGIAPNPAQGMAELIASLHNPDGSIAVPGFCDSVTSPTDDERAAAEASAPSDAAYEADIGCPPVGGESGLPPVVRNSFRPTIEVNGLHTGYGGPGSKTVIPQSAIAKLSMRLMPDQRPDDVMAFVEAHLRRNTPRGMKLFIEDVTGAAAGFRLPLASPIFRLASALLEELDERGPVFLWDGASIPVVSALRHVSGAAPLLVGWGQPQDRIHAPNESYGLDQFSRAMAWGEKLLSALADPH